MRSVRVSGDHRIVVPTEVCRALGIEAGDRLEVEIIGDAIVLRPQRGSVAARMRGLGHEIWQGVDPVEHVRQLRQEWDERISG